jgi:hypothetical protein
MGQKSLICRDSSRRQAPIILAPYSCIPYRFLHSASRQNVNQTSVPEHNTLINKHLEEPRKEPFSQTSLLSL